MSLARDTWLIFGRYWLLFLRNPVWVIIGIVQPVFYLVLFAPLLKPLASVSSVTARPRHGQPAPSRRWFASTACLAPTERSPPRRSPKTLT